MTPQLKIQKNIFKLTKENEANKNRIIKDIRNLFEHEEEGYYKPVAVIIILNMKVMVREIKQYQLHLILIKLDRT